MSALDFVKAFKGGFSGHADNVQAFDAGATTAKAGVYNTRQHTARAPRAAPTSGPRQTTMEGARLTTLQIMGAAELPHRDRRPSLAPGRAKPVALPALFSAPGANRKAALAGGSQPAFFKIISGASGFHRVDTLFNYLGTREIDPENGRDRYNIEIMTSDGRSVRTEQERKDLVDEWADQFGPDSKSRDVHRFAIGIHSDERLDVATARTILGDAFEDRRFVFAVREMGGGDYTITAAVATTKDDRRDMNPSEFSHAIHDALKEATEKHGDELQFTKREAAGRAFAGIKHQLDRFAEGDFGVAFDRHGIPLEATNLRKEAGAWTRDIGQGRRNDVLHTVFSARAGTDPQAFRRAVLDTLDAEFPGYRFAVAAHDDKRHVHIHAVIQTRDKDGERLRVSKDDIERIRQTLAEKAREAGIDMVHTRRDDRAAAPSYTKEQAAAAAKHPKATASREAYERKAADAPTPPRSDAQARRRAEAAAEWRGVAQTLTERPEAAPAAERAAAEVQRHEEVGYKSSVKTPAPLDRSAAIFTEARNAMSSAMTFPQLHEATAVAVDRLDALASLARPEDAELIREQQRELHRLAGAHADLIRHELLLTQPGVPAPLTREKAAELLHEIDQREEMIALSQRAEPAFNPQTGAYQYGHETRAVAETGRAQTQLAALYTAAAAAAVYHQDPEILAAAKDNEVLAGRIDTMRREIELRAATQAEAARDLSQADAELRRASAAEKAAEANVARTDPDSAAGQAAEQELTRRSEELMRAAERADQAAERADPTPGAAPASPTQRALHTAAEKERQEARAAVLQAMERGAPNADIEALREKYRATLDAERDPERGHEPDIEI